MKPMYQAVPVRCWNITTSLFGHTAWTSDQITHTHTHTHTELSTENASNMNNYIIIVYTDTSDKVEHTITNISK